MKHPSTARTAMLLVGKIVGLTLTLLLISALGSRFVPVAVEDALPEGGAPDGSFLLLLLGILFMQTVAIAYPVLRSRWSGWRLVAMAFLIFFGPVTFLSQVETFLYLGDDLSPEMQRGIWLMGTFNAVVFAPIVVWVLGGWRRREPEAGSARTSPFTPGQWAWRVGLLATVFVSFYYLFGYYVAWQEPVLREYYGGTDPAGFLPHMRSLVTSVPFMVLLQLLRGALAVAIAIPVIRMMKGAWWESGLALALLFSVPSLYLLLPNPLMPELVARTHLVETLPYQFLFGWIVAWLLRTPTVSSPVEEVARREAPAPKMARG